MVWQCYPVIANKEILDMQHHHQRMNSQETRQPGITQGRQSHWRYADWWQDREMRPICHHKQGGWMTVGRWVMISGINLKEQEFLHESGGVMFKKWQWGVIRTSHPPPNSYVHGMSNYCLQAGGENSVFLQEKARAQTIPLSQVFTNKSEYKGDLVTPQILVSVKKMGRGKVVGESEWESTVIQQCQTRRTQIIMVKALYREKKGENGKIWWGTDDMIAAYPSSV